MYDIQHKDENKGIYVQHPTSFAPKLTKLQKAMQPPSMSQSTLIFQPYSNSIRQMPENYLIAYYAAPDRCWRCDPDLAADKILCTHVFLELMNYESKYEPDGHKLLNRLLPAPIGVVIW